MMSFSPWAMSVCILPLALRTKSTMSSSSLLSSSFYQMPSALIFLILLCSIVFFRIIINISAVFLQLFFPSGPIFCPGATFRLYC